MPFKERVAQARAKQNEETRRVTEMAKAYDSFIQGLHERILSRARDLLAQDARYQHIVQSLNDKELQEALEAVWGKINPKYAGKLIPTSIHPPFVELDISDLRSKYPAVVEIGTNEIEEIAQTMVDEVILPPKYKVTSPGQINIRFLPGNPLADSDVGVIFSYDQDGLLIETHFNYRWAKHRNVEDLLEYLAYFFAREEK